MGEYMNIGSCNGYMYNFNGSPDRVIGIDSNIFFKPHLGFGVSDLVCLLLAIIQGNHVHLEACLVLFHWLHAMYVNMSRN